MILHLGRPPGKVFFDGEDTSGTPRRSFRVRRRLQAVQELRFDPMYSICQIIRRAAEFTATAPWVRARRNQARQAAGPSVGGCRSWTLRGRQEAA